MTKLHQRIQATLTCRYDTPIMHNTYRADYIECLVAFTLGSGWWLTENWVSWDCQHTSGARLEVKQSSARQSWDLAEVAPPRSPRFDIAPCTGYWTDGGQWQDFPGRPEDIYVFAWHGERHNGYADHRDTSQWLFFIVAEQDLPENRKRIGLAGLKSIVSPCYIAELKRTVEARLAPVALKAQCLREGK